MDYLDEQILELKRQQKKEKYQSLETGFYIRDELRNISVRISG